MDLFGRRGNVLTRLYLYLKIKLCCAVEASHWREKLGDL